MDQAYEIRRKVLVDGVGIRGVARECGVSRNTVRKRNIVDTHTRRNVVDTCTIYG